MYDCGFYVGANFLKKQPDILQTHSLRFHQSHSMQYAYKRVMQDSSISDLEHWETDKD